jgi:hypothetical protein
MALKRQTKFPRSIFTVGTTRGGRGRLLTVVVVVGAFVVVVVGATVVEVDEGVVVVVVVVVVVDVVVVGVSFLLTYGLNDTGK